MPYHFYILTPTTPEMLGQGQYFTKAALGHKNGMLINHKQELAFNPHELSLVRVSSAPFKHRAALCRGFDQNTGQWSPCRASKMLSLEGCLSALVLSSKGW